MSAATEAPRRLRTLPDLLRPGLDLVFVGINPGERSARLGHYYGHPGNAFWPALSASGLVPEPAGPEDDRRLPAEYGIGFTDVVKRVQDGQATSRERSRLREQSRAGVPTAHSPTPPPRAGLLQRPTRAFDVLVHPLRGSCGPTLEREGRAEPPLSLTARFCRVRRALGDCLHTPAVERRRPLAARSRAGSVPARCASSFGLIDLGAGGAVRRGAALTGPDDELSAASRGRFERARWSCCSPSRAGRVADRRPTLSRGHCSPTARRRAARGLLPALVAQTRLCARTAVSRLRLGARRDEIIDGLVLVASCIAGRRQSSEFVVIASPSRRAESSIRRSSGGAGAGPRRTGSLRANADLGERSSPAVSC